MKVSDPRETCRLGQGEKCCAFLVMGPEGFECGKEDIQIETTISKRLASGTMVAKGLADWPECLLNSMGRISNENPR